MRGTFRYIADGLNWAAPMAALLLCLGGVLGPDVHGLLHAPGHGPEPGEACAFEGEGAHVEEDWAQMGHDDCTLCNRVELAVDVLEAGVLAPSAEQGAALAWHATGLLRQETPDRGRGPPARG